MQLGPRAVVPRGVSTLDPRRRLTALRPAPCTPPLTPLLAALLAVLLTVSAAGCSRSSMVEKDAFVDAMIAAMQQAKTYHLQGDSTGSARVSFTADADLATNAMDLRLTPAGGNPVRLLLVGGVFYLGGTQGDERYLKIDPRTATGPVAEQVKALGALSLDTSLEQLKANLVSVESLGTESVGGESLDKYALVTRVNPTTGAANDPSSPAPTSAATTSTTSSLVWLDGSKLLRRMESGQGGSTVTYAISRWGQPVSITAPPASDVVTQP
ncbi:hypothetical protein MM440_09915 [Arsenicicoccus piscis]|uniref:hypothetical protein n=1 Tax=Arsenicicoccus piscis TaxID=673954 RepID=UPI001F4C92C1|nr:hypothetical protein [Arsenicicoccus piscis]MCH8628083.1 hypothetical protein [Arsenicicoccus piscis]